VDALALTLTLAGIVAWCLLARPLHHVGLTAPIVFVVGGLGLALLAGPFDAAVEPDVVRLIAEVTLIWVLFADASRLTLRQVRLDAHLFVRLVGLGLPLVLVLATVTAVSVLGFDPWAAFLVGAALVPTDLALAAGVVEDVRVPARTRRALNLESSLSHGLATPVVILGIAGVAAEQGIAGVEGPGHAGIGLLVGLVGGVLLGGVGGLATRVSRRRGWLSDELGGPAALTMALLLYVAVHGVHGNGFVAVFVGGLVYAAAAGHGEGAKQVYFVDQLGALASALSWLLFGALAVPVIGSWMTWELVLYALLSLTLVRLVPVALALLGAGFPRHQVLLIGWFGPRGLASVTFALLALELLGEAGREPVAVIALTVLLSVVLHGVTAGPVHRRSRPERVAADRDRTASP